MRNVIALGHNLLGVICCDFLNNPMNLGDEWLVAVEEIARAILTIGSWRSGNQTTATSPTSNEVTLFQTNSKSPFWKAGSIDSDVTTIIGVRESVTMHKSFHDRKTAATI